MSTSRWNLTITQRATHHELTSDTTTATAIGTQLEEATAVATRCTAIQLDDGSSTRWTALADALNKIEYRDDCTLTQERISTAHDRVLLKPTYTRATNHQIDSSAKLLHATLGDRDHRDLEPLRQHHAEHMIKLKTTCHELIHTAAIAARHRPNSSRTTSKPVRQQPTSPHVDWANQTLDLLRSHFDPTTDMPGATNPHKVRQLLSLPNYFRDRK